MPTAIPESRVLDIWRSAVQSRGDLLTTADEPVKVVYPGRPNDGRGADLKDAVIATVQGLFCGDIEIHVQSSAWWAHGHHQDPAYNQVVLHVVYEDDAGKPATLQNGLAVPTLALGGFAEEQAGRRITSTFTPTLANPCRRDMEKIAEALDQAGETRFFNKSRDFAEELLQEKPGQVLYRGLMTALGFARNKTPMARLAEAVPLAELEEITTRAKTDEICRTQLEARLLGGAGLLPSQRLLKRPGGEYETELERLWASFSGRQQMSAKEWEFFKVRPGNYPTRRLAAMAVLLTRLSKRGLLAELKTLIEKAEDEGSSLDNILLVGAAGYWAKYIDFGLPVKGAVPALVGQERAGEIMINVALPFYTTYAGVTEQTGPAQKAKDIYRYYPAAAENSLEKHMRQQLGLPSKIIATAQRRQGLLHIYKTFCTQGKCGECPLGEKGE